MTSPTQHSLKHFRDRGYTCQVVEYFNAFAKRRMDLFGCIDIIAIREDQIGVIGIQTTSASNMGARILKTKKEPVMQTWLAGGNKIIIHGWKKLKSGRYELKEYEITAENIFLVDK